MFRSFKKKTISPKVNNVIVLLTLSDVFTWGLMIVINAIVGIYLAGKLDFDAVRAVGTGTAIYSFVVGLTQVPIGTLIDKIKKDTDDILALFVGNILMGLPFLFFPLIQTEYVYYVLMLAVGLGSSINVVSWRKLFATNIDKNKEGLEYGLYESTLSLSAGIFSLIAGIIANISAEYFDAVIVAIGLIMMSSGFWALLLFKIKNRASAR